MKEFPPLPAVDDDAAPTFDGHLWLLEFVEGTPLRFQLRASGAIRFGGERRTYDDSIPRPCRRAVRHVRERLDREALRGAVDDVTDLTFLGRATHRERIDYDWDRLPPFLGVDVWSADAGAFRPPGAVEAIFERLGLDPVTAVEREVNSRDFDPVGYEMPESAWYDGPAAGVVIRDKRGNRALVENSEISTQSDAGVDAADAESLADTVATEQRFGRVAARLRERGREPTVDGLRERLLEDAYREEHGRLFDGGQAVDESAFRTAVARRAQRFLGE
ncbi:MULTISPECIES: hypothetical protein [Halolamina]|uniref:RNA ligase domain-containing protein n=1 Tax=Halolamina pelagica TaxID=699431 RepID=A0A1I5N305_9EURY|nr:MULTISPECIES: hypothetical protein [Halolamina]NHX36283.1 hypothetical protein [Halolamina sp. R1-12]SFP16218.1 hypothetical protein SAMN05216277_101532 [Halolamina pelagica]